MKFKNWSLLEGSTFSMTDPQYRQWSKDGGGVYATNGAPVAIISRSAAARPLPDLCLLALLGNFRGYFPGYSQLLPQGLNYLTWAILKAHTNNTAGTVTLRSADPRDMPEIRFRYFEEGNDASGEDLQSVVEGLKLARKLTAALGDLIEQEELPGRDVQSDADLAEFVRAHAWGHHPSCTCPIGPRDKHGVVNGNFEVHGVTGLRVVDASVFPRIPGFFLVTPVYMVGEKASDVILAAAK
jgi:choline dehydrogenase-like flavoprotein